MNVASKIILALVTAVVVGHGGSSVVSASGAATRTSDGLLVLYDFSSTEGDVVPDRSGAGEPLDLRITQPKAVKRSQGSLEIVGKVQLRSDKPATKVIDAVRQSGAVTIEAWVRPADTGLSGPARMVTLSRNANERNFTLGQDGDRYDVRLRTTGTSTNGIPSASTPKGSVKKELSHIVYTRDRSGRVRLYLNGKPAGESTVAGSTSAWADSYQLALADEFETERQWKGTYHLVAIYSRDLSPSDVKRNFDAGPQGAPVAPVAQAPRSSPLFETQIAAILANHCLECHDATTRKGGLDLSRKDSALAGGESGPSIVPGQSAKSLLWQYVESGEMPSKRPALSAEQKKVLHEWIDGGAPWTLDFIDPLVYEYVDRAGVNWIRRLTIPEYIETVRAAVGVDIAQEAYELLPPDLRADGFSNTAYNLNVDLQHVEAYSRLAEIIAGRMDVLKFAGRFSKSRSLSTDDTLRDLVSAMGKWLLRGPLDDREITNYSGIATTVASAGGDFKQAMTLIVEAMLQSPRFIYRVENQSAGGAAWPAGPYELASRMSYIVWGGPPDEALMRAADSGELSDRRQVEAQVQRMLKDPRAIARSKQFIHEWLDLGRLANMRPNAKRFPGWTDELARDMREETLAFFQDVVWDQARPLSDLLNAQVTYATPGLARHYGLKPQGKGLARYDLQDVPGRGGLLTQGSTLTVGGDEASMVARGLFVLHELLRGAVKDPPPCVDTNPPPTRKGLTQRGISEGRIANANCGGCHAKFEPLAFGLERFDGIGAFHAADDHGNPLRDDGEILFPGAAAPVSYKSAAELMDLLASSERVRESITWKLAQFALGRPLGPADAATVAEIHQAAQKGGGTYASTLTALVTSDLVRMTRKETSK